MFGFGAKKLVAIDIGTSTVKLAEVESGRSGAVLKKFAVYPLGPGAVNGGEIIDGAQVSECISTLVKTSKVKTKLATTGLWGASVIVKKISMPKMDAHLVAEQIKWEAEQYIPFDVNEISLEHHILTGRSAASESLEVLLVAAKQEFVFRFVETIEAAGMQCSVLDVSAFALANCFEANYGQLDATVCLLNVGAGVTNMVVVDRGEVIFCRDIAIGGNVFTSEINKMMGVSTGEAESLKISASVGQEVPAEVHNILANANEQVVDEIRNAFEFYSATSSGASISRMYVSGGSIFVPGLIEQVSKSVTIPYEVFDPFLRMTYDTRTFSAEQIAQIKAISPVALGLAMRKPGEG
jgi:type IV pilus assembly protein PilM